MDIACFYLKLLLHYLSSMQPQFFRSYGAQAIVGVVIVVIVDTAAIIHIHDDTIRVIAATRVGRRRS